MLSIRYSISSAILLCTMAAASAAPCTKTEPLAVGSVATCAGILWPQTWSLRATECVGVDLEMAKVRERLASGLNDACKAALTQHLAQCQNSLDAMAKIASEGASLRAEPTPWAWLLGGVVLGVVGLYTIDKAID